MALAEKISALMTEDYLEERGERARFEEAMGEVADIEAGERDRL